MHVLLGSASWRASLLRGLGAALLSPVLAALLAVPAGGADGGSDPCSSELRALPLPRSPPLMLTSSAADARSAACTACRAVDCCLHSIA